MSEYEVNWRIQVEAETFDEAARIALDIVRDCSSEATFFEVTNRETGEIETIDADLLSDRELRELDELTIYAG